MKLKDERPTSNIERPTSNGKEQVMAEVHKIIRIKPDPGKRRRHAIYSYPFGLFRCQRHASEHISAMPYFAPHFNCFFAWSLLKKIAITYCHY